ncbi:unnamed protein product [Amoebophrya sp. A120]|nr:unnamed protein product [Amoebophrya sp. A120]|eukprot:GSA120T00009251001.1
MKPASSTCNGAPAGRARGNPGSFYSPEERGLRDRCNMSSATTTGTSAGTSAAKTGAEEPLDYYQKMLAAECRGKTPSALEICRRTWEVAEMRPLRAMVERITASVAAAADRGVYTTKLQWGELHENFWGHEKAAKAALVAYFEGLGYRASINEKTKNALVISWEHLTEEMTYRGLAAAPGADEEQLHSSIESSRRGSEEDKRGRPCSNPKADVCPNQSEKTTKKCRGHEDDSALSNQNRKSRKSGRVHGSVEAVPAARPSAGRKPETRMPTSAPGLCENDNSAHKLLSTPDSVVVGKNQEKAAKFSLDDTPVAAEGSWVAWRERNEDDRKLQGTGTEIPGREAEQTTVSPYDSAWKGAFSGASKWDQGTSFWSAGGDASFCSFKNAGYDNANYTTGGATCSSWDNWNSCSQQGYEDKRNISPSSARQSDAGSGDEEYYEDLVRSSYEPTR